MVASEMILKNQEVNSNEKALKAKLISKRRLFTLPQWGVAWLVLLPALVFLTIFMIYPIVNTFFNAFIQEYADQDGGGTFALANFIKGVTDPECDDAMVFGLFNFYSAIEDPDFKKSILNTFILVIVEVPLTIIISLLIATFLNSIKAFRGFYQTIFFLPYVTNAIALGLVFNIVFASGQGGLMNILLSKFGVDPINWLSYQGEIPGQSGASRFHQGFVIVTFAIWNGLAFKILVFMAGLATIDSQYYNAAKIDGASSFTIWRRITLPLLSPQILYITITSFIGAFKMYTGVMSVYTRIPGNQDAAYYFGGINSNEWIPMVGWIYRTLDGDRIHTGTPAAASFILLGIIMVITAVQFAVSKKRVHY